VGGAFLRAEDIEKGSAVLYHPNIAPESDRSLARVL
jgi:hypothetical protein